MVREADRLEGEVEAVATGDARLQAVEARRACRRGWRRTAWRPRASRRGGRRRGWPGAGDLGALDAEMPTPPQPNTTTELPGVTLAVMAAPTPVITPQPTRLPISSGMSSSIFTTPWCGMIISSAKVPAPAIPNTGDPSRVKCACRPSPSGCSSRGWAGCAGRSRRTRHRAGSRRRSRGRRPSRLVTPSPTSATMPAPSCRGPPAPAAGWCR